MNAAPKRKVVLVLGSGFSTSLTSGDRSLIGNRAMPTLGGLAEAMLAHLDGLGVGIGQLPFPTYIIEEVRGLLERNQKLSEKERFDFEQLLSLVAIKSAFAPASDSLRSNADRMKHVLQCLIYLIPSLFAEHLAMDGKLVKNRNLFYAVKDASRVRAIQGEIRHLVDTHDVTIISFNYDGLIEAFLDCDLGEAGEGTPPAFRYFPEVSHGFKMMMPEHVFGRPDMRDLSKYRNIPRVLKPHGSMHFYCIREEIRNLTGAPQLVALHPRFDLSFDAATMARDIPDIDFWRYADPIPFIVPPVLNKEAFLSLDYLRVILGQAQQALAGADAIVGLGFSIPRSDLHVNALFEYAAEERRSPPRVGLLYRQGPSDETLANWTRVFGKAAVHEIEREGIPTQTAESIAATWNSVIRFIAESPS